MDFNIRNLWVFEIGGVEVWITETMVATWIIMAVLIIFAVVVRLKLKKFSEVPSGFQNVVEAIIEMFDGFIKDTAGEKLQFLGNWFFMVIMFILISNISGLFGLRPPTSDWSITFAFAIVTLVLIQVMGFKYRKGEYLKSFFKPFVFFFPINVMGELSRPISLSFRLFGNVLSGVVIMSLIHNLAPIWARFILPAAIHAYFDIAVGLIQTYIFCALSLAFIASAAGAQDD